MKLGYFGGYVLCVAMSINASILKSKKPGTYDVFQINEIWMIVESISFVCQILYMLLIYLEISKNRI